MIFSLRYNLSADYESDVKNSLDLSYSFIACDYKDDKNFFEDYPNTKRQKKKSKLKQSSKNILKIDKDKFKKKTITK